MRSEIRLVMVDTETVRRAPWCVQFSLAPGVSRMVMARDTNGIGHVRRFLERDDVLVVFHNALFDLTVLADLDIFPINWTDTMVMAYLLQDEPLGLKALAFRHCNVRMRSYKEMVHPASEQFALDYLSRVLQRTWPDPDLEDVIRADGTLHTRKPQNISKRIIRAFHDQAKGERDIDLRDRWNTIREDMPSVVELVEVEFGEMPEGTLADIPLAHAVDYVCQDASELWGVYSALWPRIQAQGLEGALQRDLGCQCIVISMMRNGILVDKERFRELSLIFLAKMDIIQDHIDGIAGHRVNIASPPQILALLREIGVVDSKETSTAAKILDKLKLSYPIVGRIQDWRTYSKYRSTYVNTLPELADSSGRIHTDFNMVGTDTGRLASRRPNLMNQPIRDGEGREIRAGFIAAEGNVLLCLDYSQIEMRLLAHYSQDSSMLSTFRSGGDIHVATAADMFNLPEDLVDPKRHRYPAKRTGFGVIYGIKALGLLELFISEGIWDFTLDDCQVFIDRWFAARPGAAAWIEETKQMAQISGWVEDLFGRRRWVPECQSSIPWVRAAGLRKAVNAPIQMGAASIIKEAMCLLDPIVKDFNRRATSWALLQIHDELVFEVAEPLLDECVEMFRYIMEHAIVLTVPILVDAEVGRDWKNVVDYRTWQKGVN